MTSKEIMDEIKEIFGNKWQTRAGRVVPDAEDVELGNDAVELTGTVLYADLADSTNLVKGFKPWFAAEVYKAYLVGTCKVIRNNGGEITAFDGDRVMAVFIDDNNKNTSAAKSALQISHIVREINFSIKKSYPSTSYALRQTVGIDTGKLFIAKTGIRNSNDLVWVGQAANYAAKLCALREGDFSSYITEAIYKNMNDNVKYGGSPKRDMWEKAMWNDQGVVIYRSNWYWPF